MATGESYKTKRVHGTILVETCKILDEYRINSLKSGAGELFLSGIGSLCTPEKIMEVATCFGEVYQFRFKIDYQGRGRGFAYLQYIDLASSSLALKRLSSRFLRNGLHVTVKVSRNIRELLLCDIDTLAPIKVYQELQQLCEFEKFAIYTYNAHCCVYIIRFKNNAAACLGHLTLRMNIGLFGSRAKVIWFDGKRPCRCINAHHCFKWIRQAINNEVDLLSLYPSKCRCFQSSNLIKLT